jgi:phosphoglycerate dehydrogenase-like enzyme
MTRTKPAETKLLICVWHRFSLWNPPVEMAGRIRARWPEMRVVHLPKYDGLERELPDTDIFVGYSLRPEQFALGRKLKWIHSTAAAVGQLMYPELRRSGIEVTNASGVHRIPMAEHILGTIVALARRFPDCFRYQQQTRWAQQELWEAPVRPRELRGQVLLFVGFGSIGQEVAKAVRPLGMHVWAVTRSGRGDSELAEKIFPAEKLHEALPQADFVVLAAPETPETRRMIGARELALMKSSAYFINVARGALVDEPALIAALEQKKIAGAALDVFEAEPKANPALLGRKDVILTPHIASASVETRTKMAVMAANNLVACFEGKRPPNALNADALGLK